MFRHASRLPRLSPSCQAQLLSRCLSALPSSPVTSSEQTERTFLAPDLHFLRSSLESQIRDFFPEASVTFPEGKSFLRADILTEDAALGKFLDKEYGRFGTRTIPIPFPVTDSLRGILTSRAFASRIIRRSAQKSWYVDVALLGEDHLLLTSERRHLRDLDIVTRRALEKLRQLQTVTVDRPAASCNVMDRMVYGINASGLATLEEGEGGRYTITGSPEVVGPAEEMFGLIGEYRSNPVQKTFRELGIYRLQTEQDTQNRRNDFSTVRSLIKEARSQFGVILLPASEQHVFLSAPDNRCIDLFKDWLFPQLQMVYSHVQITDPQFIEVYKQSRAALKTEMQTYYESPTSVYFRSPIETGAEFMERLKSNTVILPLSKVQQSYLKEFQAEVLGYRMNCPVVCCLHDEAVYVHSTNAALREEKVEQLRTAVEGISMAKIPVGETLLLRPLISRVRDERGEVLVLKDNSRLVLAGPDRAAVEELERLARAELDKLAVRQFRLTPAESKLFGKALHSEFRAFKEQVQPHYFSIAYHEENGENVKVYGDRAPVEQYIALLESKRAVMADAETVLEVPTYGSSIGLWHTLLLKMEELEEEYPSVSCTPSNPGAKHSTISNVKILGPSREDIASVHKSLQKVIKDFFKEHRKLNKEKKYYPETVIPFAEKQAYERRYEFRSVKERQLFFKSKPHLLNAWVKRVLYTDQENKDTEPGQLVLNSSFDASAELARRAVDRFCRNTVERCVTLTVGQQWALKNKDAYVEKFREWLKKGVIAEEVGPLELSLYGSPQNVDKVTQEIGTLSSTSNYITRTVTGIDGDVLYYCLKTHPMEHGVVKAEPGADPGEFLISSQRAQPLTQFIERLNSTTEVTTRSVPQPEACVEMLGAAYTAGKLGKLLNKGLGIQTEGKDFVTRRTADGTLSVIGEDGDVVDWVAAKIEDTFNSIDAVYKVKLRIKERSMHMRALSAHIKQLAPWSISDPSQNIGILDCINKGSCIYVFGDNEKAAKQAKFIFKELYLGRWKTLAFTLPDLETWEIFTERLRNAYPRATIYRSMKTLKVFFEHNHDNAPATGLKVKLLKLLRSVGIKGSPVAEELSSTIEKLDNVRRPLLRVPPPPPSELAEVLPEELAEVLPEELAEVLPEELAEVLPLEATMEVLPGDSEDLKVEVEK